MADDRGDSESPRGGRRRLDLAVAVRLYRAEELRSTIEGAFCSERAAILALLPEVIHTGGTSLPDALTRGDLDIHVRVPPEDFPFARDTLAAAYPTDHPPAMWTSGFATFVVADASVPTGIALTCSGQRARPPLPRRVGTPAKRCEPPRRIQRAQAAICERRGRVRVREVRILQRPRYRFLGVHAFAIWMRCAMVGWFSRRT